MIGYWCVRVSYWQKSRNPFYWALAGTLGSLAPWSTERWKWSQSLSTEYVLERLGSRTTITCIISVLVLSNRVSYKNQMFIQMCVFRLYLTATNYGKNWPPFLRPQPRTPTGRPPLVRTETTSSSCLTRFDCLNQSSTVKLWLRDIFESRKHQCGTLTEPKNKISAENIISTNKSNVADLRISLVRWFSPTSKTLFSSFISVDVAADFDWKTTKFS